MADLNRRYYVQLSVVHDYYHDDRRGIRLLPRKWFGSASMCLAIPMQVRSTQDFSCICEARGIEREVSLFMMQEEDISPGDFVLVHVGYAIQKISAEDAAESWQLFDEILADHA